jgi:hypothetical protein
MNTHNSLVDFFLACTKSFLKHISIKLMDVVLFIYLVSLKITKPILILSLTGICVLIFYYKYGIVWYRFCIGILKIPPYVSGYEYNTTQIKIPTRYVSFYLGSIVKS